MKRIVNDNTIRILKQFDLDLAKSDSRGFGAPLDKSISQYLRSNKTRKAIFEIESALSRGKKW